MTKIIKVDYLLTPVGYNSFLSSISTAEHKKNDSSKAWEINGKIVNNYWFNDNLLIIEFNNNKFLIISPGARAVTWDVLEEKPPIENCIDELDLFFEIPGGEVLGSSWKLILDSFIGRQVAISPSDQYLFIFSRGGPEYKIDILFDVQKPEDKFLFISEV